MLPRFRDYVNSKYGLNAPLKIKNTALIDPKYEVKDDSWQNYPTARAIENLLGCAYILEAEPLTIDTIRKANGTDSLLDRLVALLEENTEPLDVLSSQTVELIYQAFHLEKTAIQNIREAYNLNIDITLREIRLWLLDESSGRIMSGYFDTLLINRYTQTGIVLKHVTSHTPFIAASDDKELGCLVLMAADAFKLKEVIVTKLWAISNSSDLGSYYLKDLQNFRKELKTFLK
jgi:hypothetical protein